MKSFKRRALAFVLTLALVLTSLVVPAFAATGIYTSGLTAAADGQSYYSGTLKFNYEGPLEIELTSKTGYDPADYDGKTADLKFVLFNTATGTEKVLETYTDRVSIDDSGTAKGFGTVSISNSTALDSIDFSDAGEYAVRVDIVKPTGGTGTGTDITVYSSDMDSDTIMVIPDIKYPVPEITGNTVGGVWKAEVDIPTEADYGIVKIRVKENGAGSFSLKPGSTSGELTSGLQTFTSTVSIGADDQAFALVQLYKTIGGTDYLIPVHPEDPPVTYAPGKVTGSGDAVRSANVTAGYDAPTAAPEFETINGNGPASDGKIYVAEATSYDVQLQTAAADAGKSLPVKTVTYDTTTVDADGTDKATLSSVLPAAAGTYTLTAAYDGVTGFEETVDLVVRDKAEVTVAATYYMSAAGVTVSGTSPEVGGTITVKFADGSTETATVAHDKSWKVIVPYDGGKLGTAEVKVVNGYTGKYATENTTIALSSVVAITATIEDTDYAYNVGLGAYDTYETDNFPVKITAEAGEKVKVTLDSGTPVTYTSTGTDTINVSNGSAVAAGLHTITVEYVTAAGASATVKVNVLASTPDLSLVVTTSPVQSKSGMVIEGTVEAGSAVAIYNAADTKLADATVDGSGNWEATVDLSSITPGTAAIYAKATKVSKEQKVDIDVAAAPGTLGFDLSGFKTDGTKYYVTNTAGLSTPIAVKVTGIPGEEVRVTDITSGGSTLTGTVTLDGSGEGTVTLTPSGALQFIEGEIEFEVEYTSAMLTGSATAKVVLDITPPTVSGYVVNDEATSVTLTSDKGFKADYTINGEPYSATDTDNDGEITINFTAGKTYTNGAPIIVKVTDLAGNTTTETGTVQTTTAGAITLTFGATYPEYDGKYYTNVNDAAIKFVVNATAGKDLKVEFDGAAISGTYKDGDLVSIAPGLGTFTEGNHTIKVYYKDYASVYVVKTVVVDKAAPEVTTITAIDDTATTLTGKVNEAGAKVLAVNNATSATIGGPVQADGSGNWTMTIAAQAAGTVIKVSAFDVAGNTDAAKDKTTTVNASLGVSDIAIIAPDYTNVNGQLQFEVTADASKNINVYVGTTEVKHDVAANTFTIPASDISGAVLLDGTYTIKAEYVDTAYAAKTVTKDIVVDTAKPAAATINTIDDQATTLTGSAEAGATVKVYIGGALVGTTTAATTDGSWTLAIAAQAAGTVITATVTDLAGNVSDTPDGTTTVTTSTISDITITTAAYTNNQAQLDITVAAETGKNINLYVGTAEVKHDVAAGTFTIPAGDITGTVLSEGTYVVKAEYVDTAYASKTVTTNVVVDITKPAAATINEVTDTATSVTGSAEAGATVEVFIGGTSAGTTTAAADGSWTLAIAEQTAGTVITATVTDPAGNVSDTPDGTTTVVITPSVTTPVVTTAYTLYDGKYYSNNRTQIKFNVAGTTGMMVNTYINTTSVESNAVLGDFTYGLPFSAPFPEGEYTIKAEYVAPGYTAGTATLVIDGTAPVVATVDTVDDQDTTITGTAATTEAGATVRAYVDGAQVGTDATVATDGSWTITGVTPLAVDKVVTVKITDLAGNQSDAGNKTATVERTTKADIVITAAAYTKDDTKLSFSVAAEAGELLKVYATGLTGTEQLIYADKTAGTIEIPVNLVPGANLDDGVYNVRVTYAKAAYETLYGDTADITVDTVAPVAADVTGLNAIYDNDTTATITLTNANDKGATVVLTIGTDTYTETDTDNDGVVTFTIDKHLVDTAISAKVTDLAGNVSADITGNKVLKRNDAQAITVTTANANLSRPTDIVYTVSAEAGRPIEATITKDGGTPVALATPVIGDNTIKASVYKETYFAEGEYVITVKYADPAYGDKTGTVTVTVINDAPSPAILNPATGDNETTSITGSVGTSKAGLTAYVVINGTTYNGAVNETTGAFTIDITGSTLEVGDVLDVMVKDAAENVADIPAAYTKHQFTVTAKDIAQIVLAPDLTFDTVEGKYFADNVEVLPAIKVAVAAQAGYEVEVTIAGPNVGATFDAVSKTITGSGDVTFDYNSTVVGYGFAPVNDYTISAVYTKTGFDSKAAADVTVAVVDETAVNPVIDTITDRDDTITGTNEAFATVEVSFDNGTNWVDATIDTTDNTKWSYSLGAGNHLTQGATVLARQTLKGGTVSGNATKTVVFADVIGVELDYGTDCALGTTHNTDQFGITLKADADRIVVVTVKHVVAGGPIYPDGWNAKEITATGAVQNFTVERDAADHKYEEGDWVVTAEYKDKAAMEAQGNLTGALDDTLTVTVIGNPQAPTLVTPATAAEVTNRTTEITVEMGDFAKTAKVYANGKDINAQVTVAKDAATTNNWNITLPMQLAGTVLEITEVDTSDVESADALTITVVYDSSIAIDITTTSVDADRVADLHADAANLVISGTTTNVLDGTEVIVTVASESDAAYALTPVTTTVTGNAWTATFTYNAAAFSGLLEGNITVTATLNDERTPDKLTDVVTIVNDKTTPDKPVIVGSNIDGTDVAGKITTRSTELYGTAAGEVGGTVKVVVKDTTNAAVGAPLVKTVAADGTWRVTFGSLLAVGYSVEATVTDLAGHTSAVAELDVTTAAVQKYELAIDALANPYVNTLTDVNGNETDGLLTFTGTTTAHVTDKVLVTINVLWGGESFKKEATVNADGTWTVTFGDDTTVNTLIKKLSDTTLTAAERTEGLKINVTAAYKDEGVTVSDEDTTNNTVAIYPDSTAPTAPVIMNETVYNRTTEIKVKSTTDYPYGGETPTADEGRITLYANGTAIVPTSATFDAATKVWTITIAALNKDVVLTATETDMAGNESAASAAKTVVEAIEGDNEPAGEVDELLVTGYTGGRQYTVNGDKLLYLNNTTVTNVTLSGEGANERVRVSFKNLDNGTNADSVITGAKEFTIAGNAWTTDLNLGSMINALPENRYEFKIEYLNTATPSAEGVIGEDKVIIIIDNFAPDTLTVEDVYDRDLTIEGGELATYADVPENYEFWFKVENADSTLRSDWAKLDPAKVTNNNGAWTVNKADLGLASGIRTELGTKVSFKQIDRAGNESVAADCVIKLSTVASLPAADITVTEPANNAYIARGLAKLTVKGKAQANEDIKVVISKDAFTITGDTTVAADGTWEIELGDGVTIFADGQTYTITVTYKNLNKADGSALDSVESKFRVPNATPVAPAGGGGGGSSAAWLEITINEKVASSDLEAFTGKAEGGKDIAIYAKPIDDESNSKGTLIATATAPFKGYYTAKTNNAFDKLEEGQYKLTAVYDLGDGATKGKYVSTLTIKELTAADTAYVLFTVGSTEYKVDGTTYTSDVAPFIDENDRTMLPLRAFANALSIPDEDITWDDATKTATIIRPDGKKIVVTVGVNVVIVNGVSTQIDTKPVIKDSRIFLPLRAMLNAFGISDSRIIWDADMMQIIIVQDAKLDIQALIDSAKGTEE